MESKIDPIITIIIPAYNSEKFIRKCINSIPRDKKIEIIIVDDFSKKILENQINFKEFKILRYLGINIILVLAFLEILA